MRLSTKGCYAITAMLDLAMNDGKGPVTLLRISQCQGISLSYLEQLFVRLRKAGLVVGARGPGGGYRLARDVRTITVADITDAVGEYPDAIRRERHEACRHGEQCPVDELWCVLSTGIHDYLKQINLAEFLARSGAMAVIRETPGEKTEEEAIPAPTLDSSPKPHTSSHDYYQSELP